MGLIKFSNILKEGGRKDGRAGVSEVRLPGRSCRMRREISGQSDGYRSFISGRIGLKGSFKKGIIYFTNLYLKLANVLDLKNDTPHTKKKRADISWHIMPAGWFAE